MVAENLKLIQVRIAEAASRAGRQSSDVRIVAAAKTQDSDKVNQAIAAGVRIIGHNYFQEAAREVKKYDRVPELQLHMIGHLQKNKAAGAVEIFDLIETIDDAKLAKVLSTKAEESNKVMGALIQVNLSGEPQKSGISDDKVPELAETILGLPGLKLRGLMTMPPFFDEPERARPYFARLRELRDRLISSRVFPSDAFELSMGMSGDYEVAVEEGATMVRIGTLLFGSRTP
jgi:pyridoxal phosphate enzyme (YggS family)